MMHWSYDLSVGALYFRLSDVDVVSTKPLSSELIADLDADGTIIGIEIIGPLTSSDEAAIQDLLPDSASRMIQIIRNLGIGRRQAVNDLFDIADTELKFALV